MLNIFSSTKLLSRIVGEIYEASYRPEHWPKVLRLICRITLSMSASLAYWDKQNKTSSVMFSCGWPESAKREYLDTWGAEDRLFDFVNEQAPMGTAISIFDAGPYPGYAMEQSPEFFKWVRKQGVRHIAGGVLFDNETGQAGISVQRFFFQRRFSARRLQLFNELMPHIQRAVQIHHEFNRLRTREQALLSGLDRIAMGLVLFDRFAEPVYINPVAQSIIDYHPAISLINGQITAALAEENRRLRQIIVQIMQREAQDIENTSQAIGLHDRKREHILPLLVTPLRETEMRDSIDLSRACVALFFSDPSQPQALSPDNLQQIYDLTPAEARVAVGLANGMSLEAIAAKHKVSLPTVKTQLSAIFQKTHTQRQAELVKLLLSGALSNLK